MGLIQFARPWDKQPYAGTAVDSAFAPLAVFSANSGQRDLYNGGALTSPSALSLAGSAVGVGVNQTAVSRNLYRAVGGGEIAGRTVYTAIWHGVPQGAPSGSTPTFVGLALSTTSQSVGPIGIDYVSTSSLQVHGRGGATQILRSGTYTWADTFGRPTTMVASIDYVAGTVTLDVWVNGNVTRVINSTFSPVLPTLGGTEQFTVGGDVVEGASRHVNAITAMAAVCSSTDRSLLYNPWQVFRPRRIWVPVAAAGGTTVAVPAGSLTLTGYAPTITNPQSIAIPAGVLTLTGFAPTVTTAQTIVVPAGALTLTGYAPTVSTPVTISVPAGALTLTGIAPTVTVSSTIAIPAGSLTLTGFAPAVYTTAGTTVSVPAGSLTLTGYAPTVYTAGGFTTSVLYLPLRAYATGSSGAVDAQTALDNLRSLLPAQRTPLVNSDGTMSPHWYKFVEYFANQFAGIISQPTIPAIVANAESTIASVTAATAATALIATQAQANAEALAAVVQVATDAGLSGADQIPPVSMSYLEP